MDRNRRNRKNRGHKNNQQQKVQEVKPVFQFNAAAYNDPNAQKERSKAIQEVKGRAVICPKCGQPITDIASSLNDKASGSPVHFDCAFNEVASHEALGEGEKIAYIGQGRFGVLYYENIRDQRHFTIKKIIEWEDRDSKPEWRDEISNLYSKIN